MLEAVELVEFTTIKKYIISIEFCVAEDKDEIHAAGKQDNISSLLGLDQTKKSLRFTEKHKRDTRVQTHFVV